MTTVNTRIDILDWREAVVTAPPPKIVGGIRDFADFDQYSDRVGREIIAAQRLGDASLYSEIDGHPFVTTGDLRRRKPHTNSPPSIEELFVDSGLCAGFDLTNLRAINLWHMVGHDRRTIVAFPFLATADLVPKGEEEPVSIAIVKADHKITHRGLIRTLTKGVQVSSSPSRLYPGSIPKNIE